MSEKFSRFLIITLIVSFVAPQVALASWWNPFSWFEDRTTKVETLSPQPIQSTSDNNPETAPQTREPQIQSEKTIPASVNNSDQSALIAQLHLQIANLQQQIKDYECPVCPTCSTCPVCQVNQPVAPPSSGITPLMASCSVQYDLNNGKNRPISFIVSPSNGDGTGVYYYTWKDTENIKLSSCGTTTNPTCTIFPPYRTTGNIGQAIVEVRSGQQRITIYCPALSI